MDIKKHYQSNIKKFENFKKYKYWNTYLVLISFLIFIFFSSLSFFLENLRWGMPSIRHIWIILSSIICGFSLPFAGTSIQGVMKNDIAGPTTLGFLPITSTGTIIAILVFKNNESGLYFQYLFTIILILIVILFIFLSSSLKQKSKNNIIILGLFIGIVFSAINSILIFINPSEISISPILGQTNYIYDWNKFYISLILIILGLIIIVFNFKKIDIIQKNEELASSLGININLVFWMSLIGSIIISTAVSYLIGSIIGVAIIIPFFVRKILNNSSFLITSIVSSFLTMLLLIFSSIMNSIYSFGLNLFCIPILLPFFILMIRNRR